jgi:hypothetical protein
LKKNARDIDAALGEQRAGAARAIRIEGRAGPRAELKFND